jgi:hypothetical protein
MNTYEHAMLGLTGALAANLHNRYDWKIVAAAATAAVLPDWDGLTYLISNELFAHSHRVWGHSVFTCGLAGIVFGSLDYRFDIVTRIGRQFIRFSKWAMTPERVELRRQFNLRTGLTWIGVSVLACLSQLPADIVVSGTADLPPWEVQILWPISDYGWTLPIVYWNDPGNTLIFFVGMFAMARWPNRLRLIGASTLLGIILHLSVRYMLSRSFV